MITSWTINIAAEGQQAIQIPANSSNTIDFWSFSSLESLNVAFSQTQTENKAMNNVMTITANKLKEK